MVNILYTHSMQIFHFPQCYGSAERLADIDIKSESNSEILNWDLYWNQLIGTRKLWRTFHKSG